MFAALEPRLQDFSNDILYVQFRYQARNKDRLKFVLKFDICSIF